MRLYSTSRLLAALAVSVGMYAQQVTNVPRLIRFSGTHHTAGQKPQAPVVGATFSIYREQFDGTPVWSEVQNIQPDKDGNYTALLGSTQPDGIPVDLFVTTEPRWLEVEIDQVKQPRILLGSVPYALKASDANTLGGLPASAFLRAPSSTGDVSTSNVAATTSATPGNAKAFTVLPLASLGTPNYIAMFAGNGTDLISSSLFQASPGNIVNELDGGPSSGPVLALKNSGGSGIGSLDFYTYGGQAIPSARWQGNDVGGFTADQVFLTSIGGGPNQPLAQRMIIKGQTGFVGIGNVQNPTDPLTVLGNITTEVDGGASVGPIINLRNTGGTGIGSFDFYTYFNQTIPSARWQAADIGGFTADHVFFTSQGGNPNQPLVERMRIKGQSGNVGIGTGSPVTKLDVNGAGRFAGGIVFGDGTAQTTAATGSGGSSQWTTNGSSIFYNNGNVGVGTSVPSQKLDVAGIGRFTSGIMFADGSLQTTAATGTGSSQWTSNGSNIFFNGGNVGIGTTSPGQKLEVNGNLMVDGFLALGGIIYSSTGVPIFQAVGAANTAVGISTLPLTTAGTGNTAVGDHALSTNSSGSSNVALGNFALTANGSGFDDVAVGNSALFSNTSGQLNTAVGISALASNTTGRNNVALGAAAGQNIATGSFNIDIGHVGIASDNGIIRIGDSNQTATFISGISGVNVSGVPVLVSSSGQLGVASSSRRFKKDIEDMGDATDNLMRLRPVTYHYKQPFEDGSQPLQYGLIAEEVADVYPELVARSVDGKIETVKYQVLDSMLLNELQKQNATIKSQETQITSQQDEIRALKERLSRIETLLETATSASSSR